MWKSDPRGRTVSRARSHGRPGPPARPAHRRRHGEAARIAHLACTYGTDGIPLPEDRAWAVSVLEPQRVLADARAARRAGADVVIASLHWGTEWQQAPDTTQKEPGRGRGRSHRGLVRPSRAAG
ncbi:hypothetical protein GCM10023079_50690 [Streptomyces chitinivorans]|uniref:CapA family protein n=1 Tax=Streptomyces chitinivorans TaxID=1257027 RepID=UPI0033881624